MQWEQLQITYWILQAKAETKVSAFFVKSSMLFVVVPIAS